MAFWAYAVTVFSLSVLFTWVFNNTRRSILATILPHFIYNSTLNVLSPLSDWVSLFVTGLLIRGNRNRHFLEIEGFYQILMVN